jgi:hypothetical protein
MAPAFFYHEEREDNSLIAPLENMQRTLSTTLFEIISRILLHWPTISEYVEQFIAGKDTFLHEDQHDRLLFDDDNFTRSRHYFWVITSIGEFISTIDETIHHYDNISGLMFPDPAELGKHKGLHVRFVGMEERFERKKYRATTPRDRVSLNICSMSTSLPLIIHDDKLFNASAVVESRLSTRFA